MKTRHPLESIRFPLLAGMALLGAMLAQQAAAETYYLDADNGSDAHLGTSPEKPWKSLEKVNATVFAPGDRLLLKAGTSYTGTLKLQGSGREGAVIVVDRYGEGAKPSIDAQGKHDEALLLRNVEYWEVSNLALTNRGEERAPFRAGVRLVVDDFGTARHIHLKGLHVHDVNGIIHDSSSPFGGVKVENRAGGIQWMTYNADAAKPSRFDGLLIENCRVVGTDRDGITGWAGHKDKGKWHPYDRRHWQPNLNVVIRGNVLEDIGGCGIVPRACVGALIEGNIVRGAGLRVSSGTAGIWCWSCDDTVVQGNDVSGVRGPVRPDGRIVDGMGYDCDFNCRNSIFQYNYSHDNAGGFIGLFTGGAGFTAEKGNVGNIGTIIRYNISQNDGAISRALFYHTPGNAQNVQIYNNAFFVGKDLELKAFSQALSEQYRVHNNVFHAEGKLSFSLPIRGPFSHNALFGNIVAPPANPSGLAIDPRMVAPGSGADGRDSLTGYQLQPGSPLIGAGALIEGNGGRDFWGNSVNDSQPPDIGAHGTRAK